MTLMLNYENPEVANLDTTSWIMLKTERVLSKIAVVPGVGLAAGALKMAIGVVQILASLIASGIFGALSCCCKKEFFAGCAEMSLIHLKNGAGNILAGFVEALPIIGTVYFFVRNRGDNGTDFDRQHDKPECMRYPIIL